MIRALVFDCFGVLYVPARAAYFSQFPDLHDQLHDLNRQADFGMIDRGDYIAAASRLTGVNEAETLQAFARENTINRPLIDFIKSDLKPHYKVGLLSNLGKHWLQDFFDEHQLHELFDAVVISSEEGIAKPNPMIYERAALRLGISPSECLMIDDHEENCEGAKAAGMQSLLYDAHQPPRVILDAASRESQ